MVVAIAALWGLAEAVLLFLVADIPISFIAVRHGWKTGALAALAAAVGAMFGGTLTYVWASMDPVGATRAMLTLPGIDASLVLVTAGNFASGGYHAMLLGSFSGVPYKLYALAAATQHEPLLRFVAMTPLVRLPRFLGVALFSAAVGHLLGGWLSMRSRLILLGALWLVIYAYYFATMPG